MEKLTGRGNILKQMECITKEIGLIINNMGRVRSLVLMEQSMKAILLMAKKKATVNNSLLMEAITKENFSKMKFLEPASSIGQTVKHMKVNGPQIKCMDKVH